ncbi:MAG: transcriptional regulator [Candidatus Bathyarchaeota archaeon]|nr:MAG: transcriptional regulator [Candidatus Bathyarchaeota archaeon]
MMKRAEMLDSTESILEKAGFHLSKRCTSRHSCFDLVANGKRQLTFIKVYVNIGNVSAKDASELQTISQCFSATPFIIGEKTRRKPLEDDTVYSRYGICAITTKTLEEMVLNEVPPLVEAGPGGYYIQLDGNLVKKRRQELELSVGKLAEMIGISRRTLYGYEKGMAKASVSTAYKLEWILGVPVAKFIDAFQFTPKDTDFFATARCIIVKHQLLQTIFKKFTQFDFRVVHLGRAPFDFIAQRSEIKLKIIGGVANKKERNVDQRTEEITSVCEIIKAQPVFITEEEKTSNNNIPTVNCEALTKMQCLEDFIAKL